MSLQALGEIAGVLKAMLDKRVRLTEVAWKQGQSYNILHGGKRKYVQLNHLQLNQSVQTYLSCDHQTGYRMSLTVNFSPGQWSDSVLAEWVPSIFKCATTFDSGKVVFCVN